MIEKVFFGLASVAVFEGMVLAIAPTRFKQVVVMLESASPVSLSRLGLIMMASGIFAMYLIEI